MDQHDLAPIGAADDGGDREGLDRGRCRHLQHHRARQPSHDADIGRDGTPHGDADRIRREFARRFGRDGAARSGLP